MTVGGVVPTLRIDYLAALGLEPMVLRTADAAAERADAATPRPESRSATVPAARQAVPDEGLFGPRAARVCVLVADGAGAQERLLRQIVQALGVALAEARFEAEAGVPTVAFGATSGDALAMPALHELRTARAKRAAWPALRRLRRRLRDLA